MNKTIIILFSVVLASLGFVYLQNNISRLEIEGLHQEIYSFGQELQSVKNSIKKNTTDTTYYKNEIWGISFSYPKSWKVEEIKAPTNNGQIKQGDLIQIEISGDGYLISINKGEGPGLAQGVTYKNVNKVIAGQSIVVKEDDTGNGYAQFFNAQDPRDGSYSFRVSNKSSKITMETDEILSTFEFE